MGKRIRQFLRELLGSRLVEHMEVELLRLQSDLQQLRQDKDEVIADLRNEKAALTAKCAIFEFSVNQKVGIDPSQRTPKRPSFSSFEEPRPMTRWQQVQMEHEKQLEKEELEKEAEEPAKV
jgi:hypothetical protein